MSATPKSAGSRKPQSALSAASSATVPGLLDAFPVWQDQPAAEKELPGKYEDPLGISLPSASLAFCDAWKRTEELVHGAPNVPLVCLKAALDADRKGSKGYVGSREVEGKLYAGHETFDWLLAVISFVVSAEKHIKKGDYLWELIQPKDKEGLPVRSPNGKYRVKLYILDTWRTVTIDDRIPVDLFGRALLIGSRPLQLWPLLLCKAILKVMAVYKCLEMPLPHKVAAFQMLTGWPQEDLVDALRATPLAAGALFDRLEEVLGGPLRSVQDMPATASCCLVKRSKPQRAPPRLVVLTGPSAVGRSQLIAKLVADFPDKFAVTVSHTSRPPREHEVDGRDYYFTTKQKLLAEVRAKRFLEAARVTVHSRPCNTSAAAAAAAPESPLSYWYGTSLATVREVAATGKLCVMSLDMQGAEALRSNKRIDGLYLYLTTSDPQMLANRQKQRMSEAQSTLSKRLTWASQQVAKSQQQGLFDATIVNTTMDEVYANVKEAISTLSPIIRNRLRGLPAYVLDYSDLIPPNSVEKPFLKPVILAGPNIGERRKLLEMLAAEFPDVFAFPRQHTTRPPDEHRHHVGEDGDELQLLTDKPDETPRNGPTAADGNSPDGLSEAVESNTPVQQSAVGDGQASDSTDRTHESSTDGLADSQVLGPPPVVMTKEEFDSAVHAGTFLEHHADLFKHSDMVHKHGHSMEHVKEVIKSGKLPLMELEAEGAEAIKLLKGVDCLTIFLAPPSIDAHEQRLKQWATESDEEIAERQEVAAAEMEAVQSSSVYDQVIVNDGLNGGYKSLKLAISKFRPDLIQEADEDDDAAQAAKKAAAANQAVPLLVLGPTGGGKEQLVQQLLQRYPHRFALPRRLTDKKPGKADKDVSTDTEYVKPDVLTKLAAQGQLVWSQPDTATSVTLAITQDAMLEVAAAGKMAVLDIGAVSIEQLQTVRQHTALKGAFAVYVCRKAALTAVIPATGTAAAALHAQVDKAIAQMREHLTAGSAQAIVDHDDPEEAFAQLQEPLSAASPWAMPPLLLPLVVAAPFGSGKRIVLQKLCNLLPHVFAVPKVVTSRPKSSSDSSEGMHFVDAETAAEMQQQGKFIVHQQVLSHVYGITAASVRKLQAAGKLPLLDLDRVEDVARLRASGFQATYIYLQPPSLDQLQQQVSANILANPPLHHEPEHAAQAAAAEAVREASEAAAQSHLFDAVLTHKPQEPLGTVGQLSEVLHEHYPTAVPSSFVWGYGRPLWDLSSRVHGFKPLKIILLGPAASGKSTQCAILASRFGIPHVNAGDLLYAEVSAKTALGLEAKQYMDSSRTVPDRMLMTLVLRRLAAPDCQTQGWALDGFPHTKQQAELLAGAGHVPDKVILLQGPHALLLDRVKHRRIDYLTGKVYHLAEAGALSAAVTPVKPDGSPDADVLARLAVRHDDSLENVANRLTLWDRQVQGLCAVYEDVLMRLPAAGPVDDITGRAEAFVKLESTHGTGSSTPGNIWPIIPSWQLEELTYKIVATLKYRRQQLVQLQQLDGKLTWCDLKELSSNCSCMLVTHNPLSFPVVKSYKRLDSSTIAKPQLLSISSAEPFRLLASLSMGPQHLPVPPGPCIKKVFVLAGPAGAGRSRLARQLLQDFSGKLMPAGLLTSRPPHLLEVQSSTGGKKSAAFVTPTDAGTNQTGLQKFSFSGDRDCVKTSNVACAATAGAMQVASYPGSELLQFVPESQFKVLKSSNQLVGVHSHLGHSYGVAVAALEAICSQGRAAVVVGSLTLAEKLRSHLLDSQVVCIYVDASMSELDTRLRLSQALEENHLQQLLQDADHQQQVLQVLLQQQVDAIRAEQARQQNAPASAGLQPAAGASTPSGASRAAKEGSATKSLQLQQLAALQQQQSQPDLSSQQPQPTRWLHAVNNPAGQLQACYAVVKAAIAEHWQGAQRHLPGLLLVQRYASSTDVISSGSGSCVSSRPNSAATATPKVAADVATICSACLDEDVYSQSSTLVRLQSITSSSVMLQLPRGQHVLQLQCSPQLLHSMTFYAASDFVLDEAAKLLPTATGLHVSTHDGRHDPLQADSRQLLFRYLLKPAEPCAISADFKTSSSAVQACSRLMLIDNSSREVVSHVLNQPSQVQLLPGDKGYTLLALAEPHSDVPAGSWNLSITSNKPLPSPLELPVQRQVLFEGVYSSNAKAVVARFVISPSSSVHLTMLSSLCTTREPTDNTSPLQTASTDTSPSSSRQHQTPLAYSLQLFDTAGAKEVTWGAEYKLVAEVVSAAGGDGRALLPSVQLQPGRYLVVLQLQPELGQQWVDSVTGATEPVPHWQVLLMPSLDEKACPIINDDAYDRYFKSTVEGWQQQAAQVAAATAAALNGSRPGSREAGSTAGNPRITIVATKDRPKQAQQALERYQQAEQQAASAPTGLTISIPGSAAAGHAVAANTATTGKVSHAGGKPRSTMQPASDQNPTSSWAASDGHAVTAAFLLDTSTPGSSSATPRNNSGSGVVLTPTNNLGVPSVAVRQMKGGELVIMPAKQLKHLGVEKQRISGSAESTGDSRVAARQQGSTDASILGPAQLAERLVQQQLVAEQGKVQLAAMASADGQLSIAAVQAQQAAEFSEWRNTCLREQQAAICRKQQLLTALAGPAAEIPVPVCAAPTDRARKQDKAASKA